MDCCYSRYNRTTRFLCQVRERERERERERRYFLYSLRSLEQKTVLFVVHDAEKEDEKFGS